MSTASLDSYTANLVIDIMKELGHEMGTIYRRNARPKDGAALWLSDWTSIDGQLSSQVEVNGGDP